MELKKRFLSYLSAALLLTVSSLEASAGKWYVNNLTGDNAFDGLSATVGAGNVGPFADIQWALDNPMFVASDSIYVSEGEYYEHIHIDRPVYLFGSNAGISGTSNSRNLETIIMPNATGLSNSPINSANCLVIIKSSGVLIDGFRIDGDNTSISSGNMVRSADVDVSYAISNSALWSNVRIQNCVVENFQIAGITLKGDVNNANFNCGINDNHLRNFGGNSTGIQCEGFYADIYSNLVEQVGIAIKLNDFKTNSGSIWPVKDNTIKSEVIGLMVDNFYQNASELLIENNIITTPTGLISDYGVYLSNNRDAFTINFSNNNISNTGEAYSFKTNSFLPINFTNDTIINCDYGLRLEQNANNNKIDSIMFTDCLFNTMKVAGIDVLNDSNLIKIFLSNSIIKNSETAILLRGNCHLIPTNTAFENINSYYLFLALGNSSLLSATDIDMKACTFNGATGATSSDSVNFITEDKIKHFLDDNLMAYVEFKSQYLYVTHNDGNESLNAAIFKAVDNSHIFIDSTDNLEDVLVDKQIDLHTRNKVSLGSISMNAPGKSLVMHGPIYLTTTLTLVNGFLISTGGTVTVGRPLTAAPLIKVSGGNANAYVLGPLRIVATTQTTDTLYFPIGKGGDFRPIRVLTTASAVGSSGSIQAELFTGPAPFQNAAMDITHASYVHHWKVDNLNGLPFDDVKYVGSYGLLLNDDEVGSAPDLRLVVEENGSWMNIGGVGTSNGTGNITSTASNLSMSYVSLANAGKGGNTLGKAGVIAAFDAIQSCFPDSIQFNDISASSTGAITSWRWNFGDTTTLGDTSLLSNPKYKYPKPGSYQVTLFVTNATAQTDVIVRTIEVNGPPTAGFEELVPCFPASVIFSDTSTASSTDPISMWDWMIDGKAYSSNDVLHAFDTTGSYTVTLKVTTSKGCVDSISKTIFQGDSVKIKIAPVGPITICDNSQTLLTATPGIQNYLWSNGSTNDSIIVTTAGTYKVVGVNSGLCTGIDSVLVITVPAPTADAGLDQTIDFGESVTLNGSGNGQYEWSPAATLSDKSIATPLATPKTTTEYILRVYDTLGCEAFDTVIVNVTPLDFFDVPNLISPNGDGHNDVWDLSVIPGIDKSTVSVINRWGKEVYKSDGYKNDWQGTYENNDLPDGTYIYIIENKDTFGVLKGSIQILR